MVGLPMTVEQDLARSVAEGTDLTMTVVQGLTASVGDGADLTMTVVQDLAGSVAEGADLTMAVAMVTGLTTLDWTRAAVQQADVTFRN